MCDLNLHNVIIRLYQQVDQSVSQSISRKSVSQSVSLVYITPNTYNTYKRSVYGIATLILHELVY